MIETLTLRQVFQQPVVPASFLISFLFLGGGFFVFLNKLQYKTKTQSAEISTRLFEKQASWYLTLTSSFICTVVSTPFVIQFIYSDLNMELLGADSNFHTGFVCFFISYLILDLVLGCMYYRQRITLMTGWVHHVFYIVTLTWFLRLRISSLFTIASILELPTLILAAGSMVHEWRSDLLFGSTFFILRLVAHAWMMIALKKYHRIQFMWVVALVIYPLHLYWFYGIIQVQLRRFSKYRKLSRTDYQQEYSDIKSGAVVIWVRQCNTKSLKHWMHKTLCMFDTNYFYSILIIAYRTPFIYTNTMHNTPIHIHILYTYLNKGDVVLTKYS